MDTSEPHAPAASAPQSLAAGLSAWAAPAAEAMVWFQGKLYVGTSAETPTSLTAPARILRYDPAGAAWDLAYEAPMQPLSHARDALAEALGFEAEAIEVAAAFGIASLAVFQGREDPHPCLYCGTASLWGGQVLRSEDGETFAPVSEPGLGDRQVVELRALTPFQGRLYVAPLGSVTHDGLDRAGAAEAVVWASDAPAPDAWQRVCAPGFGDPVNRAVTALTATPEALYAGTAAPTRGFQLWRLDGAAAEWRRVLTDGAERHTLNPRVTALAAAGEAVYIGAGVRGYGYDNEYPIGPAAAELIRLEADGAWDLIVGQVRFTPDGLKTPLSGQALGFGDRYNGWVSALAVLDGTLYVGLYNWEPYDWIMAGEPARMQGGFELWTGGAGRPWEQRIKAGNGVPTATRLAAICAAPGGLYLGTEVCPRLTAFRALHAREADAEATFDVLSLAP